MILVIRSHHGFENRLAKHGFYIQLSNNDESFVDENSYSIDSNKITIKSKHFPVKGSRDTEQHSAV